MTPTMQMDDVVRVVMAETMYTHTLRLRHSTFRRLTTAKLIHMLKHNHFMRRQPVVGISYVSHKQTKVKRKTFACCSSKRISFNQN
jgi:hypothetical protein